VRQWIDARNKHDLEAALAVFSGELQDRVRRTFVSHSTSFPDITITVEEMIAEGDKVAMQWRFQGTHRGEFQGVAATGRTVDWRGVDVYEVRDGRIVGVVRAADNLAILQQLGVAAPVTPGA